MKLQQACDVNSNGNFQKTFSDSLTGSKCKRRAHNAHSVYLSYEHLEQDCLSF